MKETQDIVTLLQKHAYDYHPVVRLNQDEKVARLDLSAQNKNFNEAVYSDPEKFLDFIETERAKNGARYLVGGYREHREMYKRSILFDQNISETFDTDEPRSLHLGVDVWGLAGEEVSAPLGGMIHSFAYNNRFGDYGATIILQHQLETQNFFSLYGHLALADLEDKRVGQFITRGEQFAHFGNWDQNGNWPPHLHFQLVIDMGQYEGDYPGVCKMSEARKFLANCPDPNYILKLVPGA